MKTRMTSKERVLTALHRREPDRVPINSASNPGIDGRLKKHFGLDANDNEGLLKALGVDFRSVWAPYRGPRLHADIPERNVKVDNWGVHHRWVEHASGGYWDYCDFPLREATEEEIAAWPIPNPDHFDFSGIPDQCRAQKEYCVHAGGAGVGDIINSSGMLRTMEQVLVDLITDDPAGLLLAKRRTDVFLAVMERTIAASKGGIDMLWVGEDLGTQIAPIISLDLYRRHIRPLHQRYVDLAGSFNIPVMIHTCGSSSWAYPDFIEMGITAVDTLQPEAANMSPEYLKSHFGNKLAFHGCISTAGPLASGTPDSVRESCRRTLDIMMPGGGYCLSPTHQIQDNTPVENVLAMYETGKTYGTYR